MQGEEETLIGDFRVLYRASTLMSMDSVRFGRALGVGARAAAKSIASAVEAASAPNPSNANRPAQAQQPGSTERNAAPRRTQTPALRVEQAMQAGQGLAEGGRRFGESFFGQVKRLSGVLWLEFTGVFFGVFALYAGSGAWKLRSHLHENANNHDSHVHFLLSAGMAMLFGYFCVSSFARAGRRGKRKA